MLGEKFIKFDYYILYGTPKVRKLIPKTNLGLKEPLETKIVPIGWSDLVSQDSVKSKDSINLHKLINFL